MGRACGAYPSRNVPPLSITPNISSPVPASCTSTSMLPSPTAPKKKKLWPAVAARHRSTSSSVSCLHQQTHVKPDWRRIRPCRPLPKNSTTPTQCCASTAEQPGPAAPHAAAHPRPSPCTRIHTHVLRTPDVAPDRIIAQVMPALRSRYCNKPVSETQLLYTRAPPCPRKSSCL